MEEKEENLLWFLPVLGVLVLFTVLCPPLETTRVEYTSCVLPNPLFRLFCLLVFFCKISQSVYAQLMMIKYWMEILVLSSSHGLTVFCLFTFYYFLKHLYKHWNILFLQICCWFQDVDGRLAVVVWQIVQSNPILPRYKCKLHLTICHWNIAEIFLLCDMC